MKIAQPIINEITPESSALLIFRGALKVNLSRVWRTVDSDLSPLDAAVKRLLQQDAPRS